MDYVKVYLAMAVAFLALDSVWLGVVAKNLYRKEIGHLMADKPNFIAAGIFYLVFLVGLLILVVLPANKVPSLVQAALGGALFGFVCYATFDLTNQAVLKDWSTTVTIADLAWGAFVSSIVAVVGYWIASVVLV